jgi:hypothetical protein
MQDLIAVVELSYRRRRRSAFGLAQHKKRISDYHTAHDEAGRKD